MFVIRKEDNEIFEVDVKFCFLDSIIKTMTELSLKGVNNDLYENITLDELFDRFIVTNQVILSIALEMDEWMIKISRGETYNGK